MGDIKMKKYLSSYNIARVILSLTCVIFFVLQSYQEMDKYFSDMKSVSTKTMKDVAVPIPNIIVCLDEPFKTYKYPRSLQEFYDITYTADEVFKHVPKNFKITSIATIWQGMCFLLKITKRSSTEIFMTFNMTPNLKIYYVDKGKELCLIYGSNNCDIPIEATFAKGHGNDIIVSAKKFTHIPG